MFDAEVNGLELKQFILDELLKLDLNGVKVVDFSIESSSTRFVIAIEQSTVDFIVNDDNQFQILSVTYNGKKYTNAEYLNQFNDFVAYIIVRVKPVVKEKTEEYVNRPDFIEYREARARIKEEQLEKRALTIQAREQLLEFQAQAIDVECQILENERNGISDNSLLKWAEENIFLLKWVGIVIAIIFIMWLFLRIIR